MSDAWDKKIEHLLRQTGTRVHAPNGLPIRCIRWDGLMTECEHGDHRDYLFPVDVVCSDPPEEIPGVGTFSSDEPGHALIYTDSNIALTLYETCYCLWHVARDGAWLSGGNLSDAYRLSAESVDKIVAYCKQREITLHHPNAREDAR